MDIFAFAKNYLDYIGGQFTSYDASRSFAVVPLKEGRFQTILISLEKSKMSGKNRVVMASRVCEYTKSLDLKSLLIVSGGFDYAKFMIEDDFLKIEASCLADTASEDELKHMIQEVANLADHFELKLTGKDIH